MHASIQAYSVLCVSLVGLFSGCSAQTAAARFVDVHETTEDQRARMRSRGQPVKLIDAMPAYSPAYLETQAEGCVVVAFEILEDGRTSNVRVVKAEPAGLFEELAIYAGDHWVFEPRSKRIRAFQPMLFAMGRNPQLPPEERFRWKSPEELIRPCLPPERASHESPEGEAVEVRE